MIKKQNYFIELIQSYKAFKGKTQMFWSGLNIKKCENIFKFFSYSVRDKYNNRQIEKNVSSYTRLDKNEN